MGAIVELKIANRFGNLYKSELHKKQNQLKQEQLLIVVKKYEAKWGPAKKVYLTEPKKLEKIFSVNKGDTIHYLAYSSFDIHDADKPSIKYNFKAATAKENFFKIMDNKTFVLQVSSNSIPVKIYFWKNVHS